MFYGIGGISTGIQRRQKEQRAERAAIREEFERWRQNNPYATAMDFHSKVKQLGAQTPGGTTVMPDSGSIQRMAAENLRNKQLAEEERERVKRVQSLNLLEAESKMLRSAFENNPNAEITSVLRSLGMEVNENNVKLAQRAQLGIQNTNQQKTEAEQQRQRQLVIDGAFRLTGGIYDNMTWEEKVSHVAGTYQFQAPTDIGVGPDGINVAQSSAPQPSASQPSTPLPQSSVTVPSAAPATPPQPNQPVVEPQQYVPPPAPTASVSSQGVKLIDDVLTTGIPRVLQGTQLTPQTLDAAISSVRSSVLRGGYRTAEEFDTALANNAQVQQLQKEARDNEFSLQLDAARDISDLYAFVDGENVGLEAFLQTAGNLSGALGGLYIPPGSEAQLADALGAMLRKTADGKFILNGKFRKMSSSELQDAILGEIDASGFVTIDQMKADRAEALMQAPELDTTEDLFSMMDGMLLPDAVEAITSARGIGKAAELQEQNIELLELHKQIALNGRAVDQYALNLYHPADVLPASELPRYREVMGAYFEQRIQELKDLDLGGVKKTASEQNNAAKTVARDTAITDAITETNKSPVGQYGADALLDMGGYGFDLEPGRLIRREDGEIRIGNPFQQTLLEEQLRGDKAPIIASAIKAALLTYLSYDAEMPDATGVGVLTSSANRAMTNWRTRTEAAKDAAEQYMIANGIDNETAKTLAQNNAHLHSQIFIRNSAPLSDEEAKELMAMLEEKEEKPDYEIIITK